jgi:hypothetical protein
MIYLTEQQYDILSAVWASGAPATSDATPVANQTPPVASQYGHLSKAIADEDALDDYEYLLTSGCLASNDKGFVITEAGVDAMDESAYGLPTAVKSEILAAAPSTRGRVAWGITLDDQATEVIDRLAALEPIAVAVSDDWPFEVQVRPEHASSADCAMVSVMFDILRDDAFTEAKAFADTIVSKRADLLARLPHDFELRSDSPAATLHS